MSDLHEMMNRVTQPGLITWIGLRPGRREPMLTVGDCRVTAAGLEGDRSRGGKRAVTLVQQEHLSAIASFLGRAEVDVADLRRNLLVSGINLLALKGRQIRVGTATLEITGICAPCSRMEEAFGHGGYSAVRGHGGVTARVLEPGRIALHDAITPL